MKPYKQNSFMSPHECDTVNKYIDLRILNKTIPRRKQKNGEHYQLSGDPLSDAIGLVYRDTVAQLLKKDVVLSYSMIRRYAKHSFMPWHRNRWEAEHAIVIQISDNSWPMGFVEGQDNPLIEGEQKPSSILNCHQGDAVVFNAAETYHGRHKLKLDLVTTLNLYYVEAGGYLDNKDRRINYGDNYKSQHNPDSHQWKISAEKQ
jgi:hypothetical protein|tara:strand:+ start:203 stop:811 length:609 start_codon:yes stop_codon:yes gene_type:complete